VVANVIVTVILFVLLLVLFRLRHGTARVLVIGTTPLAYQIADLLAPGQSHRYRLAGIVAENAGLADSPLNRFIVGRLDHLAEIVKTLRPDRIVIALADRRKGVPMRVLLNARLEGIKVADGVTFFQRLTRKVAIEALSPDHVIFSAGFRRNNLDGAMRRTLSVFVSAVALVVLAPLGALIAVAIKIESRGPILFVQDRIGLGGRQFALLKFRTMYPVSRPISEWAGDNEARITRLGRWLRRSRLDELPQLVNILRGDMNLVGPRPHPVCNFDLFLDRIPYYAVRTTVRPGLTGWAQVKQGYANGLDEEIEKMRYDLYYIEHRSAWLDLRILFGTMHMLFSDHASNRPARTALSRRPAYGPSAVHAGSHFS
jgi:exopolysaccharide biosynthesis polyprenyl glycosylphosphotransferase